MPGTYVARGDVGRGLELAGRTRESVGKNTGLNRSKIDCLQRFGCKAFNFRTINASDALRAYFYMHRIIIYITVNGANFVSKPDLSVNHSSCLFAHIIYKCVIVIYTLYNNIMNIIIYHVITRTSAFIFRSP